VSTDFLESTADVPTLLQQARFALGELGTRPHKRLGQHFLIDPTVIDRMIAAARIGAEDTILEIGSGLGALSDKLAGLAARLYLVEVDTALADRLRGRFADNDRVRIITSDFLSLNCSATFPEPVIRVVASLPYNVATPILFRLLEQRHKFPEATVMLQKEVAERLTAAAGSKAYGVPSLLTQLYAVVTPVCTVGPRSFFPAPKSSPRSYGSCSRTTLGWQCKTRRSFAGWSKPPLPSAARPCATRCGRQAIEISTQ